SSFTCAGCLVSSADTDADDKCSPDRSASSRRSCAPVQTSRCAAASRNCHLICITISFQPGQGARDRTAVRVLDERRRRGLWWSRISQLSEYLFFPGGSAVITRT